MAKFLFSTKISFIPAGSRLLRYSELPEDLRSLHPFHAETDDSLIAPWDSRHCYPQSDFLVTSTAYAVDSADPEDLLYCIETNEDITIECENEERYGTLQMRFNTIQANCSDGASTGIEVKTDDGWKEIGFDALIDEAVYKENVEQYGVSRFSLSASAHKTLVKALMSHCSRLRYGEAEAIATVALNFAKNAIDEDDVNLSSYFQENNAGSAAYDVFLAQADNADQCWIIRECDLSEDAKKILLEDSIDKGLIVLSSRFARAPAYREKRDAEVFAGKNIYVVVGGE